MIYEKKLVSPTFRRRSITRELSLFKEKSGALLCRGLHFREEDGCLTVAEGAEKISALPAGTEELYTTSGHDEIAFARAGSTLQSLDGTLAYTGVPSCTEFLSYRSGASDVVLFGLKSDALYLLKNGAATVISGAAGGDCACIAYERLLTASEETVRWSKPLVPDDWALSLHEAGYVQLPSKDGNITAMIPFKERVYLIRERGIAALRAQGDELSFRAEEIPCACGTIKQGTAKLCGGRMIFLAEGGLYSFDGSNLKRLSGCGCSEIDLEGKIKAVACGGRYYAGVTLKNGQKCIWVVDPEEERGHFTCVNAEMLAGGGEFLFAEVGEFFRLTGNGLPSGSNGGTLTTERSLLGLSPRKKYLDGIVIEGRGWFCVEMRAEKGAVRIAHGAAGERIAFPAPVQGTSFSLSLRTFSGDARIKSVTFDLREATW